MEILKLKVTTLDIEIRDQDSTNTKVPSLGFVTLKNEVTKH